MQDHLRPRYSVQQRKVIEAHVTWNKLTLGRKLLLQIAKVEVRALAGEIVKQDDMPAIPDERFGCIHPDESGSPGDGNYPFLHCALMGLRKRHGWTSVPA